MAEPFDTHFEPATDHSWPWTILLLHGTGGNERDLLPLGHTLAPGAALLGVRGQVTEHGAPRFFRRFGEGQLDLDDLKQRAVELAEFLQERNSKSETPQQKYMIVGYSNGANMGTGLLQIAPELFAGGVLIRAMWSLALQPLPSLSGQHILLLKGMFDQMTPSEQVNRLEAFLTSCGAAVTTALVSASHGVSEEDIEHASDWLARMRRADTVR